MACESDIVSLLLEAAVPSVVCGKLRIASIRVHTDDVGGLNEVDVGLRGVSKVTIELDGADAAVNT